MRIVADPATNSLIIYGTAQEFQNIKNILKELDAVPRQVLLDVLILEITLSDSQSLGFDYSILENFPGKFAGQRISVPRRAEKPRIPSFLQGGQFGVRP